MTGCRLRVRMLGADGVSVQDRELDAASLGAATDLPYDIARYFVADDTAIRVPVAHLVLSRARIGGVPNAARLMRAAYEGRHPRRPPISLRSLGAGDFVVADGNSTAVNAIASGWPDIIGIVIA